MTSFNNIFANYTKKIEFNQSSLKIKDHLKEIIFTF